MNLTVGIPELFVFEVVEIKCNKSRFLFFHIQVLYASARLKILEADGGFHLGLLQFEFVVFDCKQGPQHSTSISIYFDLSLNDVSNYRDLFWDITILPSNSQGNHHSLRRFCEPDPVTVQHNLSPSVYLFRVNVLIETLVLHLKQVALETLVFVV